MFLNEQTRDHYFNMWRNAGGLHGIGLGEGEDLYPGEGGEVPLPGPPYADLTVYGGAAGTGVVNSGVLDMGPPQAPPHAPVNPIAVTQAVTGFGSWLAKVFGPQPSLIPGTGLVYNPQTGQMVPAVGQGAAGTALVSGSIMLPLVIGVVLLMVMKK